MAVQLSSFTICVCVITRVAGTFSLNTANGVYQNGGPIYGVYPNTVPVKGKLGQEVLVTGTYWNNEVTAQSLQRFGPATTAGGFGPGSQADMYCAYCRRRGFHRCIKRWCNRGALAAFLPSSPPLPAAGGFGPGSQADMYCAYCRRRGLQECIKRWCNRGALAASLPLLPPLPPSSSSVAAASAAAAAGGGFVPASQADMYCAYCRQRGFHTCIKRWCNRRTFAAFLSPSPSPEGFVNNGYYMSTFLGNPNTVFKRKNIAFG